MRAVGVVLDLTLRHTNGVRSLEIVKEGLLEFVKDFDEDMFYLYHELVTTPEYRRGKQVHAIASYETDGYEYDLYFAIKQTLWVLDAEDYDYRKTLYIISDRFRQRAALNRVVRLSEKEGTDIEFVLVLISADAVGIDEHVRVVKLNDATQLAQFFEQENSDGNDTSIQSSSEPQDTASFDTSIGGDRRVENP